MKRTCSLCGGRLRDGICTECGMDNRRSDEMYKKVLNKGECDKMKLSHVHEEQGARTYKKPVLNQERKRETRKDDVRKQFQPKTFSQNLKKTEETKKPIIAFLVIAFVGIGVLLNVTSSILNSDQPAQPEYAYEEIAVMEEEGELWEEGLPAGFYVVGVDLPEGRYEITGKEGNSCNIYDRENGIFLNEMFGIGEYKIEKIEDVPLFQGAVIDITGHHAVTFRTENAQMQELMGTIPNPQTEGITVTGSLVAGSDFPEGVYDVYMDSDDFGIFQMGESESAESPVFFSILMKKDDTENYPQYCSVYKNMVIPAGAIVDVGESTMTLVSSEKIVTEDYLSYYDNMY